MVVVADLDALDLWVEPYHWLEEDREAIRDFIRQYRAKRPKSESERDENRAWLEERLGIDLSQGRPPR